ncbi:uncharacterized protein LOC126267667 [Schistocerca gregaria]|uniref:uncharacterized protein LOC126267667 n=1 Tax=Schistocerca gregaria TaxID=7010 RepID=UPI00211E718B|nr:uncharacterized protein LOC126267667 [Schistocerca gregaria]
MASDAPAPAASEDVSTPEATAPPPSTASHTMSTRPRPANRRLAGSTPRGYPAIDYDSRAGPGGLSQKAAAPPPSSDGAAPAASIANLANIVAQLTALVTNTTKLIEVLSQQLTAAVLMAAPATTTVNPQQLHQRKR